MYSNIGQTERMIRILAGIILVLVGMLSGISGYIVWAMYFFGIILIATGALSWCGLYSIIGYSSKGYGIDKITRRDIEKAVKAHSLEPAPDMEKIKPIKVSNINKEKKKKEVKKKQPVKKTPIKKNEKVVTKKTNVKTKKEGNKKNTAKKSKPKKKETTKKPTKK